MWSWCSQSHKMRMVRKDLIQNEISLHFLEKLIKEKGEYSVYPLVFSLAKYLETGSGENRKALAQT